MSVPKRRSPSVWWKMAAVVFGLVLFLVPLGILVPEMLGEGGGPSGSGGGAIATGGSPGMAPGHQSSRLTRPKWRKRSREGAGLFSGRSAPGGLDLPGGRAPFSSTWREKAAPDLSGEAISSGSVGGSIVSGGGETSAGGRVHTDGSVSGSRSSTFRGNGSSSRRSSRAEWQSEMGQFAGRVRALSNQLGHMTSEPSGRNGAEGQGGASSEASSRKGTVKTNDNPPLPDEPTVPIDDHLYLLALAGLLWGALRVYGT